VRDHLLGMIAVDMLKEEQKHFDATVAPLTDRQIRFAAELQDSLYKTFNEGINHKSIPVDMEEIQLRLHAPSLECASLQVLDFVTKNFGLLYQRGPSSGLWPLLHGRLYYIVLWIKGAAGDNQYTSGSGV